MDMDEMYKGVEDDKEIGDAYKGSVEDSYDKQKEQEEKEWEMGLSEENREIVSPSLGGKEEAEKEEAEKKKRVELDGIEEDEKNKDMNIVSDRGVEMEM